MLETHHTTPQQWETRSSIARAAFVRNSVTLSSSEAIVISLPRRLSACPADRSASLFFNDRYLLVHNTKQTMTATRHHLD